MKTPKSNQRWLVFEVDSEGKEVLIILCTPEQREWARRHGHKQPVYMDATHGMQRYGLKLVTVHVKDETQKGADTIALLSIESELLVPRVLDPATWFQCVCMQDCQLYGRLFALKQPLFMPEFCGN